MKIGLTLFLHIRDSLCQGLTTPKESYDDLSWSKERFFQSPFLSTGIRAYNWGAYNEPDSLD